MMNPEQQARFNARVTEVAAHGAALVELAKDVTVDVVSKIRHQRGQAYGGQSCGLKATIGKRDGVKFIRLFGNYKSWGEGEGTPVDRTFKIGDTVEYDSYNLSYMGTITNITDKRVTVKPKYSGGSKSMDLHSFTWRNYKFDVEKAIEENHQTSYYI